MTRMIRSWVPAFAAATMIAALGMATPARANLQIQLSTNGTTFTTVASAASGGTTSFTSGAGQWDSSGIRVFGVNAASNSPGGFSAQLFGSTSFFLKNLTGSDKTLYIKIGDTGFTAPTGLVQVDSLVNGVVLAGGTFSNNSLQYISYIDPANGQNSTPAGNYNAGTQTPAVNALGGYSSEVTPTISGLTGPYSITQYFKFTLGAGSSITFTSLTTVTGVPEPSTMAIAGLGAIGLIGVGLRRRRLV